MSKILLVCENSNTENNLANLLRDIGYETMIAYNEEQAFKLTNECAPDIAIIDTACSSINTGTLCKKLKLQSQANDIQIVLITSTDSPSDQILVGADGYITKPFNDNILIATVNAHLRIKKLLDILYTNNSELARSLYQLNVLYNTSSQLAGTLDKARLVNIMNTGLEKSLNYSICLALIIDEPEEAKLIIHSLHPVSKKLEQALKLRAVIGYKSLFDGERLPFDLSIDNIKVEKYSKHQKGEFDIFTLDYDSLFAPISTSDKFFGTVEILREVEFTGEDSTCFQTVVKQVSLPLESAILYDELKKTNEKLEKLEKLKSEFISIVSHELRTPLTSIKNSLDIMLSGRTGEITSVQNNFLSIAKRNVDRLSGIINDLLDLSKIEAGKMEYRFTALGVNEPIEFVKSTFEQLAEKKNISLCVRVETDLPQIYGDVNRIEQVLSNLVSNAIKFTPEKGEITVSAVKVSCDMLDPALFYKDASSQPSRCQSLIKGDYVKVSVKDTGIGIKQADIPKVFDKFQQIESSLSREVGGTGLGLPIAKQLIEAHRGEIWIESEFQKGTTFSFILPILDEYNRFVLELDNELQHVKYNHSNLALVLLKGDKREAALNKAAIYLDKNDKLKQYRFEDKIYVIVSNLDRTQADNTLKRLRDGLLLSDCEGVSFGISVYPEDAITTEELIEHADRTAGVALQTDI